MTSATKATLLPELVFGIVGPIGVNMDAICDSLSAALRAVSYDAVPIHLTKEMLKAHQYQLQRFPVEAPTEKNFFTEVMYKIRYANALCKEFGDAATMARIAMRAISDERKGISGDPAAIPERPTAYIVRQLKRPDEVVLFRRVYGRQFILVSAYGPVEQREQLLEDRLRLTLPPGIAEHEISHKASQLIDIDSREDGEDFGQNVRETFHLADVFIDGLARAEMDAKLTRFVQAFFGRTSISPTKSEYGMYAAKSASLRSADLSRQVGAAAFTDDGELITQGCNEVPKAFGGTYWDTELPDNRDVKIGHDPNDVIKLELLRELFDKMKDGNLLSDHAKSFGTAADMVEAFTKKRSKGSSEKDGPLANCAVLDLTEFGRVVHAEMCAICDAARLGRSLKGATLYVTTFPCHNCTKHILAAGIKCVVYIEPYPKSRARQLHKDEIDIEKMSEGRVSFLPFLGISPVRYRDIFQRGKRKKDGRALPYMTDPPSPMIEPTTTAYLENEDDEWGKLVLDRASGEAN